jgi:hypothetical protein
MEYNEETKDLVREVGRISYDGDLPLSSNPYQSSDLRALWIEGWREAEIDAQPEQPVDSLQSLHQRT